MAKPSRSDLLLLGLPAPAAVQTPSLVEQVDAAAGLLFIRAHGMSDGDAFSLRLHVDTTLGATAGTLPPELDEGVAYEAVPVTADSFRVRDNGSTILTFASAGTGRFSVLTDPADALDKAIDDAWATVHARLIAHGGDVEAEIVTIATRYFAARLYVTHMAAGDPVKAESFDGLVALWTEEYKPLLEAYFRGVPVRGGRDATPTVSEGSPRFVKLAQSATATDFGTCSEDLV